jgi:uncharacterized protein YbjT (DUF2867 family)
MILVAGATGLLGTRICERLRAERQLVRALVRRTSSPDKINALRSVGCELVTGDLKEPLQIQAACQGITALISTASSTLSRQPGDTRFEVETIPEANLRQQLDSANDSLEKSFAGIMLKYAHGDSVDMRGALALNPVRLMSVREYAKAVALPR